MHKYQTQNPIKLRIFSRHPSHDPMRDVKCNFRVIMRFGSTRPTPEKCIGRYMEFNVPEAIKNSASKIKMKQCFTNAGVLQANYIILTQETNMNIINNWIEVNDYEDRPLILKSEHGSRNEGNIYFNNAEELRTYFRSNRMRNAILEKYYKYSREYRLHVTEDGCFYTCRKMLRTDAQERWFRNDSNSVWILEENPLFDKPTNWEQIENECVKALKAVGLDFGACDVLVQSSRNENPKFIICEINSAPSFGKKTFEKYLEQLEVLIHNKIASE